MTDKDFWKKLDRIASKKQTPKTTMEFIEVLMNGYLQDCTILILGVDNQNNQVQQCCFMTNGEKTMIYFTDKRHVKKCRNTVPVGSTYVPRCCEVKLRDVIDNAIGKKEISGIIFNDGTAHEYLIPKMLLIVALLKYKPIPE